MNLILPAALLLALCAPLRAADRPAAGSGGPEVKTRKQLFKPESRSDRDASMARRKEMRAAHREKTRALREKARPARKEKAKKAEAVPPAAPAAK